MKTSLSRAGKEYRVNTERYFHVMGQGWFVLTREGISGPYIERDEAQLFVKQLVDPDSVPPEHFVDEDMPLYEDIFMR